jgi:glycosyltransferase involved in cell wall biosynthesis
MIEALACGTPVIAWRNGSVPEVIEDGLTGFVVENVEEAAEAVRRVQWLSRTMCRKMFEHRFDAARMARDYVDVYRRLVRGGTERLWSAPPVPDPFTRAHQGRSRRAAPVLTKQG